MGDTLPAFWSEVFPTAFDGDFSPPAVEGFDGTAPNCAGVEGRDLGYCADDDTVYLDETDLATPAYDDQRGAYERAIAFGLARLQGIETFDGLIAHYVDHRHHNRRGRYAGGRPIDPSPGTVERWVADAIAWAGDPTLQPAIVEENAFWLRAKQVMRTATAR